MARIGAGTLVLVLVTSTISGCGDESATDTARATDDALAPRGSAVLVPLGPDRVFVFGGDGEGGRRSDAATIDLDSGEAELIASEAPFPDAVGEVEGVLAGDHVVLLGILCPELVEDDIDPCRPGTPAMVEWSVIDGT